MSSSVRLLLFTPTPQGIRLTSNVTGRSVARAAGVLGFSAGAAASASSFLSASLLEGAAEPFHLAAQDNTGRAEDLGAVSKGLATDPRNAMRIAIATICTGCERLQQ